ncbi:MAG: polysaccharide biosynthesis tyrosine autokinase [Planctomycetota bacterium]|nr:polysaccharide biosynthesis tyrosine autokinase [Planctomycetota bacterium]
MAEQVEIARPAQSAMGANDYLRVLIKHIGLILGIFLISVTLFVIWASRATKVYRAEARLHVYQRSPRLVSIEEVLPMDPGRSAYHKTQVEIIRSRKIAGAVYRKLHLDEDPIFKGQLDPIQSFRSGIEVRPKKDTGIIEVAYKGVEPEKITVWVQEIIEEYLTYNASLRRTTTAGAEQKLKDILPDLQRKLSEKEKDVADFHREHDIVTFEKELNILLERMQRLDGKLADTLKDLAALAASWETIEKVRREAGNIQALPVLRTSRAVQDLRAQEREAAGALADAKTKYIDSKKNRKLDSFKTRLSEIRGALDREVEIVLDAVRTEYDQKLSEEQKLEDRISAAKKRAQELESLTTEYQVKTAAVERYKRLHEDFSFRAKEMESSASLDLNNVVVLDKAEVPKIPIWPRKGLIVFLGALLGAIGGIGAAFLIEFLDESVRTVEDVNTSLKLPVLGYVPRISGKAGDVTGRDLISHREPKSTISEYFRTIRTGLLYSHPNGGVKSLIVTSAGPKEGKTTNAINLAITLAAGGSRVLLVDGDLRRSRIHKAFGANNDRGLATYLAGEADFDEVVFKETGVQNLCLVTSGPIPANPAEMLGTDRMLTFMKEAAERFDRVIIDTPPVVAVTDACVLASMADGVIQVVGSAKISRKVLERGKAQLSAVGARILGVILNDVRLTRDGYGYYRGYYSQDH